MAQSQGPTQHIANSGKLGCVAFGAAALPNKYREEHRNPYLKFSMLAWILIYFLVYLPMNLQFIPGLYSMYRHTESTQSQVGTHEKWMTCYDSWAKPPGGDPWNPIHGSICPVWGILEMESGDPHPPPPYGRGDMSPLVIGPLRFGDSTACSSARTYRVPGLGIKRKLGVAKGSFRGNSFPIACGVGGSQKG